MIGVTGNVGSRVAAKAAAKGIEVRGVARHPEGFRGQGVELSSADLTDPSAAAEVLKGATAVYLTPPEQGEDPLGLESAVTDNVLSAVEGAKVDHLILHSLVHGDRGDTGARILDAKYPIEQRVRSSGIPYTILAPGWFLQNLFGAKQYLEQGMFSLPWPKDRPWAATSVEDIAEAALACLEKGPANRRFDLHLEGGLTCARVCQAASDVLGKPVQFQEFSGPTREFVEPFPISGPHKDLYAELFDYFRDHEYLGEPETIKQALPGFRYTTPEQFLRNELFT
ncbi:MAG: NAD(P)H-binding protein [Actinomycetota bacterium]